MNQGLIETYQQPAPGDRLDLGTHIFYSPTRKEDRFRPPGPGVAGWFEEEHDYYQGERRVQVRGQSLGAIRADP